MFNTETRDPWERWPELVKQRILRMHSQKMMVRDIAKKLYMNKILVGAFLRSSGKVTHRGEASTVDPSPEEIAIKAKEIRERNMAKMRGEKRAHPAM